MDPSSHGETGPGLTLLDVFVMIIVLGVGREITNMNIGINCPEQRERRTLFSIAIDGV